MDIEDDENTQNFDFGEPNIKAFPVYFDFGEPHIHYNNDTLAFKASNGLDLYEKDGFLTDFPENESLENNEERVSIGNQEDNQEYLRENLMNDDIIPVSDKIRFWLSKNPYFIEKNSEISKMNNDFSEENEDFHLKIKEKMRVFLKFLFEDFYQKKSLFKVLKKILENTRNLKESENLAQKCLLFSLENSRKYSKPFMDSHAIEISLEFLFSNNLSL